MDEQYRHCPWLGRTRGIYTIGVDSLCGRYRSWTWQSPKRRTRKRPMSCQPCCDRRVMRLPLCRMLKPIAWRYPFNRDAHTTVRSNVWISYGEDSSTVETRSAVHRAWWQGHTSRLRSITTSSVQSNLCFRSPCRPVRKTSTAGSLTFFERRPRTSLTFVCARSCRLWPHAT